MADGSSIRLGEKEETLEELEVADVRVTRVSLSHRVVVQVSRLFRSESWQAVII